MQHRPLGTTGMQVSEVGLGAWQLGGADWGDVPEGDALAILHRAADLGVNFIDTADVYGMGRSERLIGRFLGERRERLYVATKLGRRHAVEHGWPARFTLEHVRTATERSLRHLGVECIDLQQWHCVPTEMMRDGEIFEHLQTLQRLGLIRHWGCSVESVEEALLCLQHPGCASLQVIFNLFRQKVSRELLPICQEKGVGVLARVPLASGLLSGRFQSGHHFDPKDHRHYNADGQMFNVGETFAGLPYETGARLAARVGAVLPTSADVPMAALALRWVLDHPAVSTVIPGATKVSQVESNVRASALPALGREVHAQLAALYDREIAAAIRGPY